MNKRLDPSMLANDVRPAQNGDPNAMDRLLTAVQDMVYYSCLSMLRNEAEAQDAAQDVLITIYQKLQLLSDPQAYLGWVKRITANRCKDRLSRVNREFLLSETEDGEDSLSFLEDLDAQCVPDKMLDTVETRRMILELIDRLPDEQRVCVILYYYNEMKTREIAEALGVSEGTVKSRLNYARKHFSPPFPVALSDPCFPSSATFSAREARACALRSRSRPRAQGRQRLLLPLLRLAQRLPQPLRASLRGITLPPEGRCLPVHPRRQDMPLRPVQRPASLRRARRRRQPLPLASVRSSPQRSARSWPWWSSRWC